MMMVWGGGFQTSSLPRKLNCLRPRTPKTIICKRKWALEAPGFLFKRLPFKLHPRPQNYDLLEELAPWNLEASKPSFSGKLRFRLLDGSFSSRWPESPPDPPKGLWIFPEALIGLNT